jgi:hypothetical protein
VTITTEQLDALRVKLEREPTPADIDEYQRRLALQHFRIAKLQVGSDVIIVPAPGDPSGASANHE